MKPAKLATGVAVYINSHARGISGTALKAGRLVRDILLDHTSSSQSVIYYIVPWGARLCRGEEIIHCWTDTLCLSEEY